MRDTCAPHPRGPGAIIRPRLRPMSDRISESGGGIFCEGRFELKYGDNREFDSIVLKDYAPGVKDLNINRRGKEGLVKIQGYM